VVLTRLLRRLLGAPLPADPFDVFTVPVPVFEPAPAPCRCAAHADLAARVAVLLAEVDRIGREATR
jgi:hypothetical protein